MTPHAIYVVAIAGVRPAIACWRLTREDAQVVADELNMQSAEASRLYQAWVTYCTPRVRVTRGGRPVIVGEVRDALLEDYKRYTRTMIVPHTSD